MSPLNGLWPLMANKVHFNPFIFSQHWLWTLSYLSSILHSFHLTDVLIIFSLPGGLRQCNNTAIALEWGCNKRTPPLPSTPPSMLTWLAEHTRLLVQSGTTSSSKSQSSLQLPVLVRATHITVPIKRWLCPQWLILWPQFMMSSTKGLFFFFFCPWPFAKNWLTGKDPDNGQDWKQKGTTEKEVVGWHHRLDGHEFEQALGAGDGQGGLVCCSPWGHKESHTTEPLNWTDFPYC